MAVSNPPPRQGPIMAATTGLLESSTLWRNSWHSRDKRCASSAVLQDSIMLMSAPAMKQPIFPEISTAALISALDWHSLKMASMSRMTSSLREFILTPGESKVMMATPLSTRRLACFNCFSGWAENKVLLVENDFLDEVHCVVVETDDKYGSAKKICQMKVAIWRENLGQFGILTEAIDYVPFFEVKSGQIA